MLATGAEIITTSVLSVTSLLASFAGVAFFFLRIITPSLFAGLGS